MVVISLPDAQGDMLPLQEYMLDQLGAIVWFKTEDEIFETLQTVSQIKVSGRGNETFCSSVQIR